MQFEILRNKILILYQASIIFQIHQNIRHWLSVYKRQKWSGPYSSRIIARVGVKSQVIGTTFNNTPSNFNKNELAAIKTLIKIQKEQVIVIKPYDKGGGIIITDFYCK